MEAIRTWLERQGLGEYAAAFEAGDIDVEVLPALTEADLAALGMSIGHRKRLLLALATLPGGEGPAASPGPGIERVTAAGERRQVTVLFCDLVGSVSLSTRLDPEELRAVIAGYHAAAIRAIQRFEGYVAQIQGDGVLAYFGYPLAHEGEAERAVRAALAVVEEVRVLPPVAGERLEVRLGIASGLVVVSHILAADRTAVGETPNLAHRLQSSARPGEIIVSERTRELAGGAFEYEDLGLHALKGIAGETRLWRVVGSSAVANRFDAARRGALTPMVGRDDEMALLLDRWERVQAGAGQVALLVGEPGIGKSRTMRALRERLGERVSRALEFQCSTFHTNSALYPIIDHLERALRFERADDAEARLDKLERAVTGEWGGGRLECQLLGRLLGLPAEARFGALDMTPQRQKEETLRALTGMVARLAAGAPTLVVFEDAHWADPTTVELLELMVARAAETPLLMLVSFRPEFQCDWTTRPHVTRLALDHLAPAQAARLITEVSGGATLPTDLVSQIVDKTDGVPLFLEELTKTVLESGMVVQRDGRYVFDRGVDRMAVPATLRDSLMARLDRLIPVKEIAQIGAVVGREFPWTLVAAVSSMSEAELIDALDSLVASGLVFQRSAPPEASYTFKHALVQDAAYDSLLKSKRQELHAAIAEAMRTRMPEMLADEPEVLAQHYTLAGMEAAAVPLWRRAGERALGSMALPEAIAHLETGLRLNQALPPDPERDREELQLRARLGTAWMAFRGWPAQQVHDQLSQALGLARRLRWTDVLVPISQGLWAHVLVRGRLAESLAIAREAIREAGELGNDDLALVGHMEAMVSSFWLGDLASAHAHGEEVLARYDATAHGHIVMQTNFDPKTAYGLYAAHYVWMQGFPDRALEIMLDKEAHARRLGHVFDLGFALTTGSHVLEYRGDHAALMQRAEEAERLGRAASVPFVSEVMAQVMRGIAMLRAGDGPGAFAQLSHAVAMWNGHGMTIGTPYMRALVAESAALCGDHEAALAILEESLEQIARPGWEERSHLAEILRLKGWVLQLLGRPSEAQEALHAALAFARQQGARSWELRTAITIAEQLQADGDAAAARALLQPILEGFTEGFETRDLVAARGVLERLATAA